MATANLALVVTKNYKQLVFSTETISKSGTVRELHHFSFQRYSLGVFRVACTSAQLIRCIAHSGKIKPGIKSQES